MKQPSVFLILLSLLCLPAQSVAATASINWIDLTSHNIGMFSIIIFALAYIAVMTEEFTLLRKSKPVLLAAGVIWIMIAWIYVQNDIPEAAGEAARHNILEYAELFLFLLVTMLNTFGASAGIRLIMTGLIIVVVITIAGGDEPK